MATITAVWTLQASGDVPRELCLQERIPYHVAVPMAVLSGVACLGPWWRLARIGMAMLVCAFATGIVLGTYHTGVEWGLWAGPSTCSGQAQAAADVHESLAGWNALVSLILAALAAWTLAVLGPRRL